MSDNVIEKLFSRKRKLPMMKDIHSTCAVYFKCWHSQLAICTIYFLFQADQSFIPKDVESLLELLYKTIDAMVKI